MHDDTPARRNHKRDLRVGAAGTSAGVVVGWLPAEWWEPLAIVSSVVSLVGIAFFPIAFPLFSTLGAAAVDVVVLAAVLWFHWVPADLGA